MKMKNSFFYIVLLLTLSISCTSNEDDLLDNKDQQTILQDSLEIKPYSYDVSMSEITLVYQIKGASRVEALYKDQTSTIWNKATIENKNNVFTITLTDLQKSAYYTILVVAYNELGMALTNSQIIQFDYEAVRGTYFMQPYLIWGTPLANAKKALTDVGNILDDEYILNGDFHLVCRFKYKELKTEYVFDFEQRLKEVIIFFEQERVSVEELRRFVSNALGYLSYGNIHVILNEKEYTFPLYKTSEGSSYVFVYELDGKTIVDYLSTSDIDLTEKLIK